MYVYISLFWYINLLLEIGKCIHMCEKVHKGSSTLATCPYISLKIHLMIKENLVEEALWYEVLYTCKKLLRWKDKMFSS